MSDAPRKPAHDQALDVVRGYVDHDAVAVREALDGLDAGGSLEVYVEPAEVRVAAGGHRTPQVRPSGGRPLHQGVSGRPEASRA
ncbi:hypothetical protein [Streptomyces sp. NPDC001307]|uniref:hypothetical protein n=1 Tax=Streptomyces sp. NPDC001307 TaxID=3364560 RepID=UPI003697910B